MQYVQFGNTGMQTSRFALGTMTFGNKLDRAASARVLDEALDHGVNFVDTADSYGQSQEILGSLLGEGKRERFYLATKVYRRFARDDRIGRNSRINILHSLERSLQLLGTDYVDLFQLHHPDPDTPVEETLRTLDRAVRDGKVRHIGVSNHYAWQIAYMLGECKGNGWEPLVSQQANYSLLDRQIEREQVECLQRLDLALMCYGPLGGGILTGKYHDAEGIPQGSRAERGGTVQKRLQDESIAKLVAALRDVAADEAYTPAQAAILWLKSKPYATTILLGGSRPGHFSTIYEAAEDDLSPEAVQRLDELFAFRVQGAYLNQPVRTGAPVAKHR